MKRLTYLLFCLVLGIGLATAQTTNVTGTVISGDDGEPIIGASVVVKGTTTGTVTDYDGAFSLNVPSSAQTLVVSYVGMEPQEVAVAPVVRVTLSSSSLALDEVVVTALGISREKKSLGYALQEVKSDELTAAGQSNLASSLSGKVAGVQITSQGNQVGASQNIVIRGNSSFSNNDPLIVVDGVPISNDSNRALDAEAVNVGSGLNDINPNDIESISVLKGGSAALYGMRAGNGVIIITTKSGRRDKGVTVSYDGDFTVDQMYNFPGYQNQYGQGSSGSEYDWKNSNTGLSYQDYARQYSYSYNDGRGNGVNDDIDESWGPRLDIGLKLPQYNSPVVNGVREATDWISHPNNVKDFFRVGFTTNHTVSVASTSEHASTRASLSYRGQEGTTPNTDQKRYAATISSKFDVNRYIEFDLSANYSHTHSDNLPGNGYDGRNVMQSIGQWFGRQVDMKDLKANWDQKDEAGEYTHYNWQHQYAVNPYWVVNKNLNEYTRDRMFGKASLWYKPTDWLKFEGRLGLDHFNSDQHSTVLWSVDYPEGFFRDFMRKSTEVNADFIAYFNKNVADFNISAIAGANYRDLYAYEKRMGAPELVVPGLYTISNSKGSAYTYMQHETRRSNSVYANVSLGWKNQLYADISARNDWDSTIEESFFYPSFSGSWIPTETFEGFGEAIALNYLKIRGGWAKIGSATDPYYIGRYYTAYSGGNLNGNVLYYNPTTNPPIDLRPEMVKTWEIGVEANFLSNRLHLDAAYYHRVTTDQIMQANVATSTGYSSMLLNAGKVKNRGVELQISGDIIKNPKGFNWTATLNWSKDKSKIIELYEDPNTGQKLEAYEIFHNWSVYNYAMPGKSWGTLVGTGLVYNEDGSILVEDGIPVYEANKEIGDVTPSWLAGFRNEFSFKEWSLGFLLDFRKGGDIYSISQAFGAYTGIYDFTADGGIRENGMVLGRDFMTDKVFKTADGQVNNEVVNPQDFFSYFYTIGELAVVDGSFLKLREAYITYTFPRAMLERTKYIKGLRVSLIGNNLALLWTHKSNLINLDPETTMSADNRGVGFESNSYPPTRSFGLKLHVTF